MSSSHANSLACNRRSGSSFKQHNVRCCLWMQEVIVLKCQAVSMVTKQVTPKHISNAGAAASFSKFMAGLAAHNALPLDRSHTTTESNKDSVHMLKLLAAASPLQNMLQTSLASKNAASAAVSLGEACQSLQEFCQTSSGPEVTSARPPTLCCLQQG